MELLIGADAEALLVTYLRAKLPTYFPSIVVATKVRNPRPSAFVQVIRSGGIERDPYTDAPLLVFHSWADTDVTANALARTVQALVKASPGEYLLSGFPVDRYVEAGGIQNNPDPDSASPRYSFSAQLDIRKSVL